LKLAVVFEACCVVFEACCVVFEASFVVFQACCSQQTAFPPIKTIPNLWKITETSALSRKMTK
jgi:hypothetical protein